MHLTRKLPIFIVSALAIACLLCSCKNQSSGQPAASAGPSHPSVAPSVSVTQPSAETQKPSTEPEDITQPTTPMETEAATNPSESTQPTQPSQSSQPSQPSQPTQPAVQPVDVEKAIAATVTEIGKLIPELQYDPAQQIGTKVELLVERGLSQEDVEGYLHDSLLEVFDYSLYLEQQNDPAQTQTILFDYTYSLTCKSTEDQFVFELCYVLNKQEYQDEAFNSNEVISLVTQRILESTQVNVKAFEDEVYTKAFIYDDIPFFYTTQMCVDRLADQIENEIYGENLGLGSYTQFRVEFHSKGETAYIFLLYLR